MSDNSGNNPLSGIVNTVQNAGQYVADTITGNTHEQGRKAAGEQITSEHTTLSQKASAVGDYVEHGTKEARDKSSAEAHKQQAKN